MFSNKIKKEKHDNCHQKIITRNKIEIDLRILNRLSCDRKYTDFLGNIISIRDFDKTHISGIEHIAQAKHNFKEEDIDFIEKALQNPYDFIKTKYKGTLYILKGTFGFNNNMSYLVFCVGNTKKLKNKLITVYATNQKNYDALKKSLQIKD